MTQLVSKHDRVVAELVGCRTWILAGREAVVPESMSKIQMQKQKQKQRQKADAGAAALRSWCKFYKKVGIIRGCTGLVVQQLIHSFISKAVSQHTIRRISVKVQLFGNIDHGKVSLVMSSMLIR